MYLFLKNGKKSNRDNSERLSSTIGVGMGEDNVVYQIGFVELIP